MIQIKKTDVQQKKVSSAYKSIVCKHCGKPFNVVRMIGFSIICPLCKKPQNGKIRPYIKK